MMIGALVLLVLVVLGLAYARALGDLKHSRGDVRDAASDTLARPLPHDVSIPGTLIVANQHTRGSVPASAGVPTWPTKDVVCGRCWRVGEGHVAVGLLPDLCGADILPGYAPHGSLAEGNLNMPADPTPAAVPQSPPQPEPQPPPAWGPDHPAWDEGSWTVGDARRLNEDFPAVG